MSARIEPISDDGQRGTPVTVSMPMKIEDGLERQKQDFLASLMPEIPAASNADSSALSVREQPSAETLIAALNAPAPSAPGPDSLQPRMPVSSDFYLTKGFKVAEGTPRQITGLNIESSDLLRQQELQAIEAKFIGRDIEIDT